MSKTLIAYASKTGTAKEAAEIIARAIPDSELCDLTTTTPTLSNYDAAIIGGGIRAGSVHNSTKQFIDKNATQLAGMKVAYFITNSFLDDAPTIIDKMLPASLKSQALFADTVGGRLDMDKLKGVDKLIAKMVDKIAAGGKNLSTGLDENAIAALVAKFV